MQIAVFNQVMAIADRVIAGSASSRNETITAHCFKMNSHIGRNIVYRCLKYLIAVNVFKTPFGPGRDKLLHRPLADGCAYDNTKPLLRYTPKRKTGILNRQGRSSDSELGSPA